jgi:hypothetical protein
MTSVSLAMTSSRSDSLKLYAYSFVDLLLDHSILLAQAQMAGLPCQHQHIWIEYNNIFKLNRSDLGERTFVKKDFRERNRITQNNFNKLLA